MPEWTDELRAEVIESYKEAKPTPENSIEIVKEIAENIDATVNGVRAILSKAGAYVKKAPAAKANGDKPASKRVNKADAIDALKEAIETSGCDVDAEIIDKLTGKAAIYFTGVVERLAKRGE
jgi:hypothetical protein